MPAASSSRRRRSGGLASTRAPMRPWLDDRGAARARRGIGEQELHVPRPHLPAVDPEGRAGAAADAPRQLKLVAVAQLREGRRRAPQMQLDLGQIERRPGGGAGEDHVVHLVAAQPARRGLAHDPAQGVDQVRLAAAIGPDDAGQARLDQQLGRLPERLEAGEAELGDLHRLRAGRMLACAQLYQRNAPVEKPLIRVFRPSNARGPPYLAPDAGWRFRTDRAAGRSAR